VLQYVPVCSCVLQCIAICCGVAFARLAPSRLHVCRALWHAQSYDATRLIHICGVYQLSAYTTHSISGSLCMSVPAPTHHTHTLLAVTPGSSMYFFFAASCCMHVSYYTLWRWNIGLSVHKLTHTIKQPKHETRSETRILVCIGRGLRLVLSDSTVCIC